MMAVTELIEMALLDGLNPDERRRLSALFTRCEYRAGSVVMRQGERSEHLFVVESGSLQIDSLQQGHLAGVGPGDCVGEIALFVDAPASASVTAATDTVLLAAPHDGMRALLQEAPLLARNFSRILSRRLSTTSQRPHWRRVSVLVSTTDDAGFGVALNLAASLAHHLGQPTALLDLANPVSGDDASATVNFEQPLETLTVVRAGGCPLDRLPSLVDSLAQRNGHVLIWAPQAGDRAPLRAALTALADRIVLGVPCAECARTDFRPWALPTTSTELLVVAAPEPRSHAAGEAIARESNVTLAGLLPETPHAMRRGAVAPDWVLSHPRTPFAQAIARLARRLARKSVGIALGGGGGRGHAHLGVLRALERLGVHADFVAGTSVGACVAGLHANGVPLHEMEFMLQRLGSFILRRSLPVFSLFAGAGLDRALRDAVQPGLKIEDFPIPCAFVAVDLLSGEEIALTRGHVWVAARASVTIPGIFPPARFDGRLLVDGSLTSPVPCRAVRNLGADIVIGVSLETASPSAVRTWQTEYGRHGPTWPAALLRAFALQQRSLSRQCLHEADVPIRTFSPSVALTDFRGGPEFVEAGERAVDAAIDRLRHLLPWVR